jgi:hypothetical protein
VTQPRPRFPSLRDLIQTKLCGLSSEFGGLVVLIPSEWRAHIYTPLGDGAEPTAEEMDSFEWVMAIQTGSQWECSPLADASRALLAVEMAR